MSMPLTVLAAAWRWAIARGTRLWKIIVSLLGRWPTIATSQIPPASTTTSAPPHHIIYRPIPGSWQRREHPNWPDSVFQIPQTAPYGTIYYITKGKQIGGGATAHVERLPSGHIVKSPKANPYSPEEEHRHRRNMEIEAEVYRRMETCPHVPRLIDWDSDSCCLTLEYLVNGDLAAYLRQTAAAAARIPDETRQRWTLQAAAALKALHAVNVIHCDLTPRNLFLDATLDLHVADFAGSSVDGSVPTIAAGPRFQRPGQRCTADRSDDIFALGSVIYFIMVGHEPYAELQEEEVEQLFSKASFPDVSRLVCGATIRRCWEGTLGTAEGAMESLHASYAGGSGAA